MATKTSAKASRSSSKKASDEGLLKVAKSTGFMSVLESIIIGVLGVLLITNPAGILKLIFYIVGIFLCVKGVYKIVNYFSVHGRTDFYTHDLFFGIIALIFGILAVALWEQFSNAIGIIVGAWLIYGSLVRMNTAIKMHAAGVRQWFYALLISLAMLALGIYMIATLGSVIAVVGWIMVLAAILGVVDDAVFLKNIEIIRQNK